jgi:hypothetical protein
VQKEFEIVAKKYLDCFGNLVKTEYEMMEGLFGLAGIPAAGEVIIKTLTAGTEGFLYQKNRMPLMNKARENIKEIIAELSQIIKESHQGTILSNLSFPATKEWLERLYMSQKIIFLFDNKG